MQIVQLCICHSLGQCSTFHIFFSVNSLCCIYLLECFENEYSCGDSERTCVSMDLVCDGNVDCPNLADEQNCGKWIYIAL